MDVKDYPEGWKNTVGLFAEAIGKPVEEVTEALASIVGEPSEEAVLLLSDTKAVPDIDLKEAFKSMNIPSGKLNAHLQKLRGDLKIEEVAEKKVGQIVNVLPVMPSNESFIEMLKVGGTLKVGETEVLSAVKAAIAKSFGLYSFPKLLSNKMEEFAEDQGEPCGEEFFAIQRLLTERTYAEVLSVIKVKGSFISEGRKNTFLLKLDTNFWPALSDFHKQLKAWYDNWVQGVSNPGVMMMAMSQGNLGAAIPGLADPPDPAPVIAAAEEMVNVINKVFAGPGIPVARAMAYDATKIMDIINDPKVLVQAGYSTKDQMLKGLGVSIGSEAVIMERNVTQYALSIMSLSRVEQEMQAIYLTAMHRLGNTIPWDKLGGKGFAKKDLRE
ncbi:MAG: hypothetical protein NT165_02095 [Candidatus Falkowbacteria bacterium]|nr:hypothetical protein [Candidatus Falkowbacteria bacterium]